MTLASALMCVWVVVRPSSAPADAPAAASSSPPAPAEGGLSPRAVLRSWDERRAAAWAVADVRALRALYVDDSRTGRRDAQMLGEYAHRGLVVDGLLTQVLALEVVDRAPRRLRLRITDRVAGGVVRAVDGQEVGHLPVDRASTRVVTLRRVDHAWRMVEVRDVR